MRIRHGACSRPSRSSTVAHLLPKPGTLVSAKCGLRSATLQGRADRDRYLVSCLPTGLTACRDDENRPAHGQRRWGSRRPQRQLRRVYGSHASLVDVALQATSHGRLSPYVFRCWPGDVTSATHPRHGFRSTRVASHFYRVRGSLRRGPIRCSPRCGPRATFLPSAVGGRRRGGTQPQTRRSNENFRTQRLVA